jgi:hypothetical protein
MHTPGMCYNKNKESSTLGGEKEDVNAKEKERELQRMVERTSTPRKERKSNGQGKRERFNKRERERTMTREREKGSTKGREKESNGQGERKDA